MATLATPAEVRAAAPEFGALTDPQIQIYLDMADDEIAADAWGSRAKRAEILLACHKMIVWGARDSSGGAGGAASGPITSVSVGDVSVSYASASAGGAGGLDSSLASSRYGVEYARLQTLAAMGGAVLDGET